MGNGRPRCAAWGSVPPAAPGRCRHCRRRAKRRQTGAGPRVGAARGSGERSRLLVRLANGGDARWWPGLGLAVGLEMQTRYTCCSAPPGSRSPCWPRPCAGGSPARGHWPARCCRCWCSRPMRGGNGSTISSMDFVRHIHARDVRIGRTEGFLPSRCWRAPARCWRRSGWRAPWLVRAKRAGSGRALAWLYAAALLLFWLAGARDLYGPPWAAESDQRHQQLLTSRLRRPATADADRAGRRCRRNPRHAGRLHAGRPHPHAAWRENEESGLRTSTSAANCASTERAPSRRCGASDELAARGGRAPHPATDFSEGRRGRDHESAGKRARSTVSSGSKAASMIRSTRGYRRTPRRSAIQW